MKSILSTIAFVLFSIALFAHEGGHGNNELWIVNDKPLVAELLKYEDQEVYFLNKDHKLLVYNLSELSPKHQKIVQNRHENVVRVNNLLKSKSHLNESEESNNGFTIQSYFNFYTLGLGLILVLISVAIYRRKIKKSSFSLAVIGILVALTFACGGDDEVVGTDTDTDPMDDDPVVEQQINHIDFISAIVANFSSVSVSADDDWIYLESNGLPEHDMMVGITSWQQQVPIDQDFSGQDRWQIPVQPEFSDNPISLENEGLANAIGIAVNGVPIYHPITNSGNDAFATGELDNWGGHSGRADDYHYHVPPTHLESIIGTDKPLGYALDGFPIYGQTTEQLDENLGRFNSDGEYQYHTITESPYFMANIVGKVTLFEDPQVGNEISPQPDTYPARPSTEPLRGNVEITDFENTGNNAYKLTYILDNQTYIIRYSWNGRTYSYEFEDPDGTVTRETHMRN